MQWKREIETHTNCALTVYMFHGASRSKDKEILMEYDVILSTCKYFGLQTLEL
jgi:DNA repair protein RAD16